MVRQISRKFLRDQEIENSKGFLAKDSRPATTSGYDGNILALQDAVGNQALSNLLADSDNSSSPETGLESKYDREQTQGSTLPLIVQRVLRSSGEPLARKVRGSMESHFDSDFSQVRVHHNSEAIKSAKAIGARAYTVGRHIVFGARQYTPQTNEGKRLLSHELVHLVQQRASNATLGQMSLIRQNHGAEREAQHLTNLLSNGQVVSPHQSIPVNTIACNPDDGLTISPTDPNLRRINPIDERALPGATERVRAGTYAPVSILRYNPGPGTVMVVTEGVHRVQAAINERISSIRYVQVTEAQVRAEFQHRGLNFDDWMQRNLSRFDIPSGPRGGGGRSGGGTSGRRRRRSRGGGERSGGSSFRSGGERRGVAPPRPSIPQPTIPAVTPRRRTRALRGGAAAMIGQLLGSAIQSIGDIGIQRRIQSELQQRWSGITQYRTDNPNQGVLVVITLQEWATPDFLGRRARSFLSLTTAYGGRTEAEAIRRWQATPRLLQGPARGWRPRTQYLWIPPLSP
ncbi:MAG: DUF4157 domain-containing protein [Crocosphaera sp.]|nr:DUF4157 domain-containing protein [Crocosphaera sp.]